MDNNKFEEIKKRVMVNCSSLHITRIPDKTKERFMELAREEFAADYGMLVKFLLDYYDGIMTSPNEVIMEKIDYLANELAARDQRLIELEKKVYGLGEQKEQIQIKTVGGRVITK